MAEHAGCLDNLAGSLRGDGQPDATEEATVESIKLPEKGEEHQLSLSHYTLGDIYQTKGKSEKVIYYYQVVQESHPPSTGALPFFNSLILGDILPH